VGLLGNYQSAPRRGGLEFDTFKGRQLMLGEKSGVGWDGGWSEGRSHATTTSQTSGNSRKKLHASNKTTKLSMSMSKLLGKQKIYMLRMLSGVA